MPAEELARRNDIHASKVIVIPFDGAAFNKDLTQLYAAEKAAAVGQPGATAPK